MCCNNYDIVIFTETWLDCTVLSSELFDDRYIVYRRDRESSCLQSGKRGGGVLIAVKKSMNSKREKQFESNCEDLWLTLDLSVARSVRRAAFCSVYLPPPVRVPYLEQFLDKCNEVFEQLNCSYVCIAGDFNIGGIDWSIVNTPDCDKCPKLTNIDQTLIDFANVNRLKQFNNVCNSSDRILDLVLCNNSMCRVSQSEDPISNIDQHHPPLDIVISLNKEDRLPYNTTDDRPNFRKTSYIPIRKYLSSIEWHELFDAQADVNEMVELFYGVIREGIEKFITKRVPKKSKFPPWFNRSLIGRAHV